MAILTRSEKLALLVNLIGDEAESLARSGLSGDALADLEAALEDFDKYPPSEEEIDSVIEDFEDYFNLALKTANPDGGDDGSAEESGEGDEDEDESNILQLHEEQFDVELEPTKTFEPPKLSGNAIHDLNLVHPYQVATALRNEPPAIISVVVRKLADEHAAKTLELLPESLRPLVFLDLASPSKVQPLVEERVFQATLDAALTIEERELSQESSEKMANLMRSLPRPVRGPMLEELEKKDSELADAVKKQLYRFEDLERVEDRDMQKVLGKCNTDVLVVALQQVEPSLLEKVLGNMSKRAKESLQEEMEFKTNAKMDEIEGGRDEVVKVLAELDEAGTITIG